MAIKKPKKEVQPSPFELLANPKVVMGLVKVLTPVAMKIANDLLTEPKKNNTPNKKVTKKTIAKSIKKSRPKLDYRHDYYDYCNCGAVKLKTSKVCKACSKKKKKK